jgi:DNA-binding transcriptional ArsR family regulator
MADALNLSVAAWAPLARGVLTGKFTRDGATEGSRMKRDNLSERDLRIAAEVDAVADDLGVPSSRVALAWTRARHRWIHPIIGARTVDQLTDSVAALDLDLPAGAVRRLDEASSVPTRIPPGFHRPWPASSSTARQSKGSSHERDGVILSPCAKRWVERYLASWHSIRLSWTTSFLALADPHATGGAGPARRRTGQRRELARLFPMTLPSFMKHVRTLEHSGLIRTEKVGRVRLCALDRDRLGPRRRLAGRTEGHLGRPHRPPRTVPDQGVAMNPELDLMLSRVIKAPRAAVWNAWTNPRNLEQWWVPAPTRCRVEQLDVTPGGAFVTSMSDDNSQFVPHLDACFPRRRPGRPHRVHQRGRQPVAPGGTGHRSP